MVQEAQRSTLGCADALATTGEDGVRISSSDFDASNVNLEQLRVAHQAWVSLTTTCTSVAFDVVQRAASPGEA